MRIYQTLRKRGLALFLALIMCLSLVPVSYTHLTLPTNSLV